MLAIKITVYRTSDDSALVPALIEAAERGKQAVCLVELKARFDERRNIGWARSLEEAGAHVVHGLPGLKTHAKAVLVVRREGSGVRHYVHIGTGNYHAKTARLYEDFGLFTCDPDIARGRGGAVQHAHGRGADARVPARGGGAGAHARLVPRTRSSARSRPSATGQDARIALKMNSLVDARCIRALYEASQAGVRVDLAIRGICCLRPGVPGVSENITVVSVVGRFLEHSRIYCFHRGDERDYWIGSPDLMPRNLDTRVELLAPVTDPALRAELEDTLERYLADDTFGWELGRRRRVDAPHAAADAVGAQRADGARGRARELSGVAPASAPARAPRSRGCACGRPGPLRASARRRGKTSFQLAEPVIRIRSAPALIERSAASATPERASTACASRLSVTITPSKPSRCRSRPVTIARDCDAIRRESSAG